MTRNKLLFFFYLFFLTFQSCTHNQRNIQDVSEDNSSDNYFSKTRYAICTLGANPESYKIGDLPCTRRSLEVNSKEKLVINFIVTDQDSEDPYEYGYQELVRYKNNKVIEKIKLRNDDAYWSELPFVRIRKQKYLEDLDGDGSMEFAVFPFHPGSTIWGTVRIYSLKEKIEIWGEGRYQFEGDTFVQLGCMTCSKFNPDECKKCR